MSQSRVGMFKVYGRDEGYRGTVANCALQSRDGYLWIGTDYGIIRYDGYTFEDVTASDDSIAIATGIWDIVEAPDGDIWCATVGTGILRCDPGAKTFRQYRHPVGDSSSSTSALSDILVDDSTLWFGTHHQGLLRYNPERDEFERFAPEGAKGVPGYGINLQINEILPDVSDPNKLYLACHQGLYYFLKKEKKFFRVDIPSFIYTSLYMSDARHLWLGTWNEGLCLLDPISGKFEALGMGVEGSISRPILRVVDEMAALNDSILWLSCLNWLLEFNMNTMQFRELFPPDYTHNSYRLNIRNVLVTENSGVFVCGNKVIYHWHPLFNQFGHQPVELVGEERENEYTAYGQVVFSKALGKYFASTAYHRGVSVISEDLRKVGTVNTTGGHNLFNDVLVSPAGEVWAFGRHKPFVSVYDPVSNGLVAASSRVDSSDVVDHVYYWDAAFDSTGNLWLVDGTPMTLQCWALPDSSYRSFALQLDPKSGFTAGQMLPSRVKTDLQGRVWVGSSIGLFCFDPETGQSRHYYRTSKATLKGADSWIDDFAFAEDGTVWLYPRHFGVFCLDPASGEISRPEANASRLAATVVFDMASDSRGDVWMNTAKGLIRYSSTDGVMTLFDRNDGILDDFLDAGLSITSNGRIAVTQLTSLMIFDPKTIATNTNKPAMHIAGVEVLGEAVHLDNDAIRLVHNQNQVTIRFTAIELLFPDRVTYAYRLDGLDDAWQSTTQRSVRFAGLGPGRYVFRVKSTNSSGMESEEATLAFVIRPALWQTAWFRMGVVVLLLVIIYTAWLLRARAIRKRTRAKAEFDTQLATLEAKALRAQMNPHFIFNSINSIKHLMEMDKKDESIHYLVQFSTLLRSILNVSEKQEIPLTDELQLCRTYLEMESMRFTNKFSFLVDHDQEHINGMMVPPLILQPYVENAIWHGLLHKTTGEGRVEVRAQVNDHRVLLTVDDNGIGRDQAQALQSKSALSRPHKGMMLNKERLAMLSKLEGKAMSVKVIDKKNNEGGALGTTVEIEIG